MPLLDLVLPLSLFWLLAYALEASLKRSRRAPLLPSNVNNARITRLQHWSLSNTTITIKKLHLTVSTTRWNVTYDKWVERLKAKRHARTRQWITIFYNAGVGFGVFGMLCAVCALAWVSGALFWDLVRIWFPLAKQSSLEIQKRSTTESPNGLETRDRVSSSVFIAPIIPGLTVPLAHLPIILLAVFLCQVFHELGHALSAVLESVPLLSAGASLTVAFPSAYVSFPPRYIENLSSVRKARIISGGPWHNAVMWVVLLAAGRVSMWMENTTSVGSSFLGYLYDDIGDIGRIVVDIEESSPLKDYLPRGSIITYLDDVPLGGLNDTWSAYLSGENSSRFQRFNAKGWCVPRASFEDSEQSCCAQSRDAARSSGALLSCFRQHQGSVLHQTASQAGCLDPIDILATAPPRLRCIKDDECKGSGKDHDGDGVLNAVCVWPDEKTTSFTRIAVRHPGDTFDEPLLWSGPKREIREQLTISRWASRFWFLPVTAMLLVWSFFDYLSSASLSLFFFNLLPIPFLDGAQLLNAVLDNLPEVHAADFDIESMDQGRAPRRWKARLESSISFGTIGLVVACVLMAIIRMMST